MITTAQELEEKLAFLVDQAQAARLMLDATYVAAETGANEQVLQLMRDGVQRIFDRGWYDWQSEHFGPKAPWQL